MHNMSKSFYSKTFTTSKYLTNFYLKRSKYFLPICIKPSMDTYRSLFRFHDENVAWMSEYFLGENTEPRGGTLSIKQRMEVLLRHLGDSSFQTGVGKDMGIHQSTVSRTFATIVEAIVTKADTRIQFPVDPADFQAAKDDWQNKFAFSCAIGAFDCTHVQILKPRLHGDEYICRKGLATLNVQVTCDASERFTISVSANWLGSVHDSRIWKNSDVGSLMANSGTDALLLGDEGYGINP